MTLTNTWKREQIKVTNILLDPSNARVAWIEDESDLNQNNLILQFWQKYDIKELIESICTYGFYQHETIIVVQSVNDSDQYTVVEGNRRLTALKSIINPELAPQSYRKWIKAISAKIVSNIDSIEVTIAPTRESALPIIVQKHASEDHSRWRPLMKAFIYWKYWSDNPSKSSEEAARALGISLSEFRDNIRRYSIYHQMRQITNLPDDVADVVSSGDLFQVTIYERMFSRDAIRSYLKLDDFYRCQDSDAAFFSTAMREIVIEIVRGQYDSRNLNTSRDIDNYFFSKNKPRSDIPQNEIDVLNDKPTNKMPSSNESSSSTTPIDIVPPQPKPARSRRLTKSIMRTNIPFRLKNGTPIRTIYEELKSLDVEKHPNASAILFRVLLDKATRSFMERNGQSNCPRIDKGGNIQSTTSFTKANFNDCLMFLCTNHANFVPDSIKLALRHFMNANGKSGLAALNHLIHNQEITYTSEDACSLWPHLEAYVKLLLSEE